MKSLKFDNLGGGISCKAVFASNVISKLDCATLNIVCFNTKKEALFFTSDLDNFFTDDCIYYFPSVNDSKSAQSVKSATAKVQRTAAIGAIDNFTEKKKPAGLDTIIKSAGTSISKTLLNKQLNSEHNPVIIVTYTDSLKEKILRRTTTTNSIISIKKGDTLTHEFLKEVLFEAGFKKVDFVSMPGEFSLRGSIIDIFSYSDNQPYRIDFFGDEIDSIARFNADTQRTTDKLTQVDIYPNLFENHNEEEYVDLLEQLPENALYWDFCEDIKYGATAAGEVVPQPAFNKNFEILIRDIESREADGYQIHILSPQLNQTIRLKKILEGCGNIDFLPISLHEGYISTIERQCWYTDHQIFERYHRIVTKREVTSSERLTLNDLMAFNIGDYVVHIDHGVGRFGGLVRTDINGKVQEAIKLTYKDGDVVFVSIHGIHRISRYKSSDSTPPTIYKLGSRNWERLKNNAKSKVKDIAADLIKLYSERSTAPGFSFAPDDYLQQELESSFMYEDTPDQHKAVEDVKRDMESGHPMDRLVCGDVGFGKTEVAIRAAFKAVASGKQVAVLVPTTILALQHYHTFTARLNDFPCNIEFISRLKTAAEVREIAKRLKEGRIDILIGTHRILGKEIIFKDLGLLIIDEEQKFGVSAKEKMRMLRKDVDTLTLTATPIPRTLQFSLLGARDISIISTPPPNRIPIHTEIIDWDRDTIKEIIDNELERRGQVFFIHNRVEDIDAVADSLRLIVPEARICVAHGQMEPTTLEKKILDFMDGDYDILVSTTIMENGVDIPNANTMIINRAQYFGLADLHQMRGRVGRSNVKAFCYLIVPSQEILSDDARARLNAIETFSDLGSGFNIAMQDLDIRGAGNLLGAEQSGFIAEMGFETYQKILSEAMSELRGELDIEENTPDTGGLIAGGWVSDCYIDTDIEACIPDDYINVPREKMRLYRELDNMKSAALIDAFVAEMTDRFGPVPPQLEELINIVRLRQIAMELGFEKIILKNGGMLAYFVSKQESSYYNSRIFGAVLDHIQHSGRNYQLVQRPNALFVKCENVTTVKKAVELLQEMLTLQFGTEK
ncbi:MAG: transcription-repair coupling factor [Bacteroidales bacterium]|nr:transcription-repair coupling factor [Bacteroidales bacterium]